MAEIKSAIELAMERTKTLVMDEKEKKEVERKELETRIRGILRRHSDGNFEKADVSRELAALQGNADEKAAVFLEVLLDILDFRDDNGRQLELLDVAGAGLSQAQRTEFEVLCRRFSDDLERKELIMRERLREKLGNEGISGDAVEVNIQSWDEWKEETEETRSTFHRRLSDWKSKVRSSTV